MDRKESVQRESGSRLGALKEIDGRYRKSS